MIVRGIIFLISTHTVRDLQRLAIFTEHDHAESIQAAVRINSDSFLPLGEAPWKMCHRPFDDSPVENVLVVSTFWLVQVRLL